MIPHDERNHVHRWATDTWHVYDDTCICADVTIAVDTASDRAWIRLDGDITYKGDQSGLLEAIANIVDAHGTDFDEWRPREVDARCLVCDGIVAPAIFHDTKCHYCGKPKEEVIQPLDKSDRLIEGQNCVNDHYVCTSCWCDRRSGAISSHKG